MQRNGTLDRSGKPSAKSSEPVTVRTYVHVITRNNGTGGVSPARLRAQLDVLNKAYAGLSSSQSAHTPFRFEVASVDVTRNSDWYAWSDTDTDNAEAKAAHIPVILTDRSVDTKDTTLYKTFLGSAFVLGWLGGRAEPVAEKEEQAPEAEHPREDPGDDDRDQDSRKRVGRVGCPHDHRVRPAGRDRPSVGLQSPALQFRVVGDE